jgi:hypothetical protein
MLIAPVAGSYIAASANACWVPTAWEQGAFNRKGVERPVADKGSLGSWRKQSRTVALRTAAVEEAVAEATVVDGVKEA